MDFVNFFFTTSKNNYEYFSEFKMDLVIFCFMLNIIWYLIISWELEVEVLFGGLISFWSYTGQNRPKLESLYQIRFGIEFLLQVV